MRWPHHSRAREGPRIRRTDSSDLFLVKPAERVRLVLAEWPDTLVTRPFIQSDRLLLMDSCFEPQQSNSSASCVISQMLQHQFGKTSAAKLRPDIHPFQFPVFCAEQ